MHGHAVAHDGDERAVVRRAHGRGVHAVVAGGVRLGAGHDGVLDEEHVLVGLVVRRLALALARRELHAVAVGAVLADERQLLVGQRVGRGVVVREVRLQAAVYLAVLLLAVAGLHLRVDEVVGHGELHVGHRRQVLAHLRREDGRAVDERQRGAHDAVREAEDRLHPPCEVVERGVQLRAVYLAQLLAGDDEGVRQQAAAVGGQRHGGAGGYAVHYLRQEHQGAYAAALERRTHGVGPLHVERAAARLHLSEVGHAEIHHHSLVQVLGRYGDGTVHPPVLGVELRRALGHPLSVLVLVDGVVRPVAVVGPRADTSHDAELAIVERALRRLQLCERGIYRIHAADHHVDGLSSYVHVEQVHLVHRAAEDAVVVALLVLFERPDVHLRRGQRRVVVYAGVVGLDRWRPQPAADISAHAHRHAGAALGHGREERVLRLAAAPRLVAHLDVFLGDDLRPRVSQRQADIRAGVDGVLGEVVESVALQLHAVDHHALGGEGADLVLVLLRLLCLDERGEAVVQRVERQRALVELQRGEVERRLVLLDVAVPVGDGVHGNLRRGVEAVGAVCRPQPVLRVPGEDELRGERAHHARIVGTLQRERDVVPVLQVLVRHVIVRGTQCQHILGEHVAKIRRKTGYSPKSRNLGTRKTARKKR